MVEANRGLKMIQLIANLFLEEARMQNSVDGYHPFLF